MDIAGLRLSSGGTYSTWDESFARNWLQCQFVVSLIAIGFSLPHIDFSKSMDSFIHENYFSAAKTDLEAKKYLRGSYDTDTCLNNTKRSFQNSQNTSPYMINLFVKSLSLIYPGNIDPLTLLKNPALR